jgi:signal transduction histidine kinase/ActR/RegA family two-component response regulator
LVEFSSGPTMKAGNPMIIPYEEQLRESEQKLRVTNSILMAAIESTADGILLIDLEGNEIIANRKFYELWNIPAALQSKKRDEQLIRHVTDQLQDPERFLERVAKIYQDPINDYYDTLHFKDGRIFERYSRPQIVDCQTIGRVWSFRDVTESRRATREMMNALLKAERASQVKSDFLANVSHEIRTPMTAILGYIDVVLEDERLKKDEQVVSSLETIRRNGEHLLNIINDILDLSKIEAGKLEVNLSRFDLSTCLSEVIELFQVRAKSKNITLSLEADTPVPEYIESDLLRIRQILMNLIGNAIKFTETGGIQMRVIYQPVYSHGGDLCIKVIDTGIGIKTEELQNLFKPFVQSDSSMNRRFGGTGLGLTISKHFAEMLNGSIEVDSEFQKGSQFTLHLPLRYESTPELIPFKKIQRPNLSPNLQPQSEPSLEGFKILLAEDGQDNRVLISHVLQKAGASVSLAANGIEAIQAVHEHPDYDTCAAFDVIIMDMQMPEMDGYTATRELRRNGYDGPIIALTAHSMNGDREKCLQAGCDEYASKPINRPHLIQLCRDLCEQHAFMKSGPKSPYGDIEKFH